MTQIAGAPNLRSKRLEQGLTMKQLAERCKAAGTPVSASEISRIERHIHSPRPALRKLLAEILGVSVTDLDLPGTPIPKTKHTKRRRH